MSITMHLGSAYKLPLPDKSVDLIITNPPHHTVEGPYYGGDQSQQLSSGLSQSKEKYWADLLVATDEMNRVLKDNGSLIIGVGQGEYPRYNTLEYEHVLYCTKELGMTLTSEINWLISPNIFSFDHLHHENKIFRHYTKSSAYVRNQFEISNLNPASWNISYVENNEELKQIGGLGHGFPLELASRMIRCFTNTESIVLDPFAGTGTVNVAAELFKRDSIYLDCAKPQFDVAKKRFEIFGLKVALK